MSQPSRASLRFGSRYGLQRAVCQFTLRLLLGLSLTLLLAWPTLLALPIQAAERIYFSFGLLERSISVASLEAYAETGQVGSDLARFLNFLTPEQQVELRTALTVSHQLSPVAVSQSFYEPMGEQVLGYIGNLIQTGKRQNGLFALRSALILAAGQPGGFTLLDVLHQFPTRGIRFDLKVALEALRQGERFFNQTNAVIDGIEQLAQQSQPSTPLDISDLPDLRQPGTVAFSKQSFTLTDASRNHSFPVDLYLPQFSSPQFSSERVPVVVLSHGLGSSRADFADVAEHFASYGFAVAMPQHVNSDFELQQAVLAGRASELFRVSEFVDRPKDVSFLLDALEQRNQTEWQNRLDLQQVAAIGHSFGGYTALALGGATVDFDNLRQNCSRSTFTASFNPSLLLQCRALEANPADREQLAAGLGDPRVKLVKRSKTLSRISCGMPRPWSRTVMAIWSPSRRAAISTSWPGDEKPIAFDSRLNRACRMRLASAKIVGRSSAKLMRSSIWASASRSCTPSTAASTVLRRSTGPTESSNERLSIEARSRMSLIITSRAAEERMICAMYSLWRSLSGPTLSSPTSCVKPMMVVSGARSS